MSIFSTVYVPASLYEAISPVKKFARLNVSWVPSGFVMSTEDSEVHHESQDVITTEASVFPSRSNVSDW